MGSTATAHRQRTALLLVVALLSSLLLAVAASAPPARAVESTGTVVGQIKGTQGGDIPYRMVWFTKDWDYLGERKIRGDIYQLTLRPGTYRVQFFDRRPAYDTTKYAPGDLKVTIEAGKRVQRDITMRRGAAITGTVRAGGRLARGAKVIAANTYRQSFETKANWQGEFAIGGLPTGSYSLFTYDRRKTWVDKSTFVRGLQRGTVVDVGIHLRRRAGSLLVELRGSDGSPVRGTFHVTAVSDPKKGGNGQFWTARARNGQVVFQGLYPGRYTMVAPGAGTWLPQSGPVRDAFVKPGEADLASRFVWTRRGASVSGAVVDAEDLDYPLAGASVTLYDAAGRRVGQTTTAADGEFRLGGQLTTQDGLVLVVQPGANAPYLGQGAHYCKFAVERWGLSVTAGRVEDLGLLPLPHLAADLQDDPARCGPSAPDGP